MGSKFLSRMFVIGALYGIQKEWISLDNIEKSEYVSRLIKLCHTYQHYTVSNQKDKTISIKNDDNDIPDIISLVFS
jgi:hypothetical protein